MDLTEEQTRLLYNVVQDLKRNRKEVIASGPAGSGKTTILRYLTRFFPNYKIAAYTGKAANVLRTKGMPAQTIHSTIYEPVYDFGVLVGFELVDKIDLCCDGFFIDEASTVGKFIYGGLRSYDLPIVFVGDHYQLEPIGDDGFNLMACPDYILKEIHRNAGEIAKFAERIRLGYKPTSYRESDKVRFLNAKKITTEDLLSVDQVICAYNRTRVGFNSQIREGLGFSGVLNVGERVICLKNNKRLGLFNGMQGEVKRIYEDRGRKLMDFEANEVLYSGIRYDTRQFGQEKPILDNYFGRDYPNPFDYAYCITTHKAQGSEFEKTLVLEQKCSKWDHRKWSYTSASRAKELVVWAS